MPVLDFDINQRVKRAHEISKHEVVIQINPVILANYTTIYVKAVVTQATSYNVLVRGVVLYPWESP
jgi:hypothetical protein